MSEELTALNQTIKSQPSKSKLTELELRIAKLESYLLSDFEDIQYKIETIEPDSANDTVTFEADYYAVLADAKNFIGEFNASASGNAVAEATPVAQPILNSTARGLIIPIQALNYPLLSYRNLMDSAQIAPISKFHYLRASLEGPAAQCIKAIEFSAANYQIAWDLLNERYNNKRLMVHNHIKSLFNIAEVKAESAVNLRSLIDTVFKKHALAKGTRVAHRSVGRFNYISCHQLPTLSEFITFLKTRAEFLEKVDMHMQKPKVLKNREHQKSFVAKLTSKSFACFVCNKNHAIYGCPEFGSMTANQRLSKTRELKLCTNCLRNNHMSKDCKAGNCRKCKKNHHTLLHFEQARVETEQGVAERLPDKQEVTEQAERTDSYHSRAFNANNHVLLSTVSVNIMNAQGEPTSCRAVLDSGSMSNFISNRLFLKLGLPKIKVNFAVSGIGQIASHLNAACEVKLQSNQNRFSARITKFIFDSASLNIPTNVYLADPHFNEPGDVDLLIGAGIFWDILCDGKVQLGVGKPVMQNTKLGWVISGPMNIPENHSKTVCNFSRGDIIVQNQLEKFWEVEEISSAALSPEESQAEQHFADNFKRNSGGRFIVSIPLKHPIAKLGESKQLALSQFLALERRLIRNPNLKAMYVDFMQGV
ncbi:hypothetical protein NQ318_005463 [Aromia moschata]|uniref:Peptidase aspartic putative domain-containing protein n=1 Tax=Aromia moschata TaxID=1265417 RepID=A0AAV8YYE0_9CUCU|nr:hypothetical protein NQ318_005463 [Aromia moschata]